jgi:hypothetical protein
MQPEIESGIEVPKPNYKEKWSFHRLEVGQSFAIPYDEDEIEVTRLRTAASAYNQRHRVRLTTRTVTEDGKKMLRVWRVE